ncbi:hypothetical protein M427DRAFT_27537 [Gonapodya prolifera JEL478]|uniref:Uncharacterized protein n=1 Tax=Gonapodya prolifera (strain JEL478) TaxID=1344416 RepID=A0A139AWF8_GONPJ|nr:hypothetical protein M427DRAFT_27537 [Gonapodya prolifera JEL478]|eukprot:KXS21081.1 hypothetical protein M427DRAFT_27537 [Gonapodya prolifera JEL478]
MLKTPPATPKTSLDGTGAPLASEGQVLFPTPPRTPGANRTRKRSRLPSALVPALLDTEPDWRVYLNPSTLLRLRQRFLLTIDVSYQVEFQQNIAKVRGHPFLAETVQPTDIRQTDPSWFHHPPLVTTTPLPAPIYQPQSRGCAECRGVLSKNEFDVAEWNNDYPRCRSCMTLFLMRGDEVPMVYEKETSEGGLGARATIRPFI